MDATPRASTPVLRLVGQAAQDFAAQVCADSAISTHTCNMGYVDATPGASAPGLHIVGTETPVFTTQVGECATAALACRKGSVVATPGACASGLHSLSEVDNALAAPATRQVGAGGSVEATPKWLAQIPRYSIIRPFLAQVSGFVAATPANSVRAPECGVHAGLLAHDSLREPQAEYGATAPPHTASNSASLARGHSCAACVVPWPTSDSQNGIESAVAALTYYVQRPVGLL